MTAADPPRAQRQGRRGTLVAVAMAAVAGVGVFLFVPRGAVEWPGGGNAAGSRFEALLGLMPDNATTRQGVAMVDFERGRAALGLTLPSARL